MTLTPQEIQTQEFNVKFRGFDVEEVDKFLEKVATEFLLLSNKMEKLNSEIEEYNSKGKAFQHAFLSAQQLADNLVEKAEVEAKTILDKARKEADELKNLSATEVASLKSEIQRLQSLRNKSKNELQGVLNNYIEMLDVPTPTPAVENQKPAAVIDKDDDDTEQLELDSDLFQKIDLPDDDSLKEVTNDESITIIAEPAAEIAPTETNEEDNEEDDGESYATIPLMDDEIVFDLNDPLDVNEASLQFDDLSLKDED